MSNDFDRVLRSIGPVEELVQGLRDYGYEQIGYLQINEKCLDAADLIEAQDAEITRLRAALATARQEGMEEAAKKALIIASVLSSPSAQNALRSFADAICAAAKEGKP